MPTRPPIHRPSGRTAAEDRRAYDHDRGSAAKRGYDARWDSYSRWFRRQHPLCVGVLAGGRRIHSRACRGFTECTDHILPVSPADPRFWDPANHQPLSLACNTLKSKRGE